MQRNTITFLGELRNGDKFTFLRKDEVFQKTGSTKTQVTFNKFTDAGRKLFPYDELRSRNTQVRFLRHTMHIAGEDGFVQDLKQGDTFFMPYAIVDEFTIDSINCDERKVHCTHANGVDKKVLDFNTLVTVVSTSNVVSV